MQVKLKQTLLSKRPSQRSVLMSMAGVFLLFLVFFLDQQKIVHLSYYFAASSDAVFQKHQYWRAFLSPLLHADLEHLTSNSIFFTGLAFLLNSYFGSWVFPVLSFIAGGIINAIILQFYPPHMTVIGASGIVYFMASFWLTLYFFTDRRLSPGRRVMNGVAVALGLLFPETWVENVSYLSHAVGFALGIPAGIAYFALNREWIRSHEVWEIVEEDFEPNFETDFEVSA